MSAEAARGARHLVLVARDFTFARGHPKALAPTADIGGVGRAVREPARTAVIMPGPERRKIDLEAHCSAEASAFGGRGVGKVPSFHQMQALVRCCGRRLRAAWEVHKGA